MVTLVQPPEKDESVVLEVVGTILWRLCKEEEKDE